MRRVRRAYDLIRTAFAARGAILAGQASLDPRAWWAMRGGIEAPTSTTDQ